MNLLEVGRAALTLSLAEQGSLAGCIAVDLLASAEGMTAFVAEFTPDELEQFVWAMRKAKREAVNGA